MAKGFGRVMPEKDIEPFDETRDPWQRFSKKTVFENDWFSVETHDCLTPGGTPAEYGLVHFKNRAVGVIPLHDDGSITLVGQYRFPLEQYSWELPEGGCPQDKEMKAGAEMELSEETGLTAKTMVPFMEFHTSNSITDEWGMVFLAQGLSQGEAAPEDSEELQIRRLPIAVILEEIEAGKITDLITVSAMYKLAYMMASGKIIPTSA